jgi:hypothetical protein
LELERILLAAFVYNQLITLSPTASSHILQT